MVSKREQAIYDAVLERDRWMSYPWMLTDLHMSREQWMASEPWVCVANLITGITGAGLAHSRWGPCSGEMERDHVHEHAGGTKGKRALTTMETLVILCHHHHQDGWATAHRPEIREYIKEANERYGNRQVRDPSGLP